MTLKLYNAISIDGFIATKNGDTSWVSDVDWDQFSSLCYQIKHIVAGRTTYAEMIEEEVFDSSKIEYYVLTKKPQNDNEFNNPVDLLKSLEDQDINEALLIGGGKTNASFLNAGLIDELILSVHPLILGDGIKLFESDEYKLDLDLIETIKMDEGLVKLRYKVKK